MTTVDRPAPALAPAPPQAPPARGRGRRAVRALVDASRSWRTRAHARPVTALVYRAGVALVGTGVVAVGLVLVPLPGPGWAIVFLGLTVLGSEFRWARDLSRWARVRVVRAAQWWRRTAGAGRARAG